MANKTISQLTAKTTPADADVLPLEDTEDTKKINYSALADAILNKLTSKTYTVAGSSQTLIAAINALNSKFTGTTYANGKVFGNGKVSLYGNNEGGNIAWESPDGTQNEIDSYNSSSTRILAFKNDGTVRGQIIFPRDMTLNLSNVLAYPLYSDVVSLPELNGRPTSSNPFSKTAGSNGVISLFAYRTSTGNTLFIQLNNSSLYTIPAYMPMGCPVIIPVCKGDVLTLTTDTTSETWTIASAKFIPSKTS